MKIYELLVLLISTELCSRFFERNAITSLVGISANWFAEISRKCTAIKGFLDTSAINRIPLAFVCHPLSNLFPFLSPFWVGELAVRPRLSKPIRFPFTVCHDQSESPQVRGWLSWVPLPRLKWSGLNKRRSNPRVGVSPAQARSTWPWSAIAPKQSVWYARTHTQSDTHTHKQLCEPKWSHYDHPHPLPEELDTTLITSGLWWQRDKTNLTHSQSVWGISV